MPRLPLVPHQGGAEASSSWFMVQSPMSISILPACERRRARAQCKRGYRGRKWNKAFNRILRSWGKYNTPGQLPWQIWHRSGCLVHLKNPFTCHIYFLWGKVFISVFHASTYTAALLGRRFEMHWLGQCENSLDTDTRIFPTARRPAQVFALQH